MPTLHIQSKYVKTFTKKSTYTTHTHSKHVKTTLKQHRNYFESCGKVFFEKCA